MTNDKAQRETQELLRTYFARPVGRMVARQSCSRCEMSLTAGDQPAYTVLAARRALVEMIRGVERLTRPSLNLLVERSPTSSERGASLGCGQAVKCFSRFISRSTG